VDDYIEKNAKKFEEEVKEFELKKNEKHGILEGGMRLFEGGMDNVKGLVEGGE